MPVSSRSSRRQFEQFAPGGVPVLAHEPDPAVVRHRHDGDRTDVFDDFKRRFPAIFESDAVNADGERPAGKTCLRGY
jgi:hypothetical protein